MIKTIQNAANKKSKNVLKRWIIKGINKKVYLKTLEE